ncbi:MAG TPA: sulfatase [Candidatus Krumholzibacteria bacterium]|nr:sulfatase [Candidatus Krumholzibacteria bacterium]
MAPTRPRIDRLHHLAGWALVLLAMSSIAVFVIRAVETSGLHGYPLAPITPNAVAAWRDAASTTLMGSLAVILVVLLPLQRLGRRPDGAVRLARLWGVLIAVGAWAMIGYRLNRFTYGGLWRSREEVGDLLVPAALVEPRIWYNNIGLTLGCAVLAIVLMAVLERLLPRSRARRAPRGMVVTAGVVLLLLAPVSIVPAHWFAPAPATGDVILISLDAMRPDRIGAYGDERGLTPNLDRLAADAVRFERAYCQEPWTLTSHMSMLTGLYPDAHGLDFGRALAGEVWTLPERMRDQGYRTAASVYDCFLLSPDFGYGAGFDRYEENNLEAADRARRAAKWVTDSDRPGFLFLHFYDPHSDTGDLPYEASPEMLERFAPGAAEQFRGWARLVGASEALHQVNLGERPFTPAQREALGRLYDAGVADTDAALGLFVDRLKAEGRYEDATIVVVADHGEALGEADHYMHELLIEETLRIPLVIKWPGRREAGTVRTDLAETVDLAPTLLRAIGLPEEEVSQGHDLAAGPTPRSLSLHRSGPDHAATDREGWRLHHRWSTELGIEPSGILRVGGSYADRGLGLTRHPEVLDRFVEPLAELHRANAVLAARFRGDDLTMTEADEELLRSLGYIE